MKLYTGSHAVEAPWLETIRSRLLTKLRVATPLENLDFPYLPSAAEIERDILRVFRKYRGELDYTRAYRDGARVDALELQLSDDWTSILDACQHNRVMLNICNLHREIPYLGEAASMLSGALHANVRLDAFCSGPGMAATPVHYDYDNAFVMQLVGTKNWRCYDNLSEVHLHFGGYRVDPSAIGKTHFEKVMSRGDGIFIPGGTLHEAFTTESASIHFAIDLSPITCDATVGYLIRHKLEQKVAHGEEFRPYSEDTAKHMLELTCDAMSSATSSEFLEWHQRYLMWSASKYMRVEPIPYVGDRSNRVKIAPGAWARLIKGSESVKIDYQIYSKALVTSLPWTYQPASMELPAECALILERIFGSPHGSNLSELDEMLSPESTDVLAGVLIQTGLLVEVTG